MRILLAAVLLVGAVAPATAGKPDKPHYTRSPDVTVEVERSERTRPRATDGSDAATATPPPTGNQILALHGPRVTTLNDLRAAIGQKAASN